MGIGMGIDMDIDSDVAGSINWGSFRRGIGLIERGLGLIYGRFSADLSRN